MLTVLLSREPQQKVSSVPVRVQEMFPCLAVHVDTPKMANQLYKRNPLRTMETIAGWVDSLILTAKIINLCYGMRSECQYFSQIYFVSMHACVWVCACPPVCRRLWRTEEGVGSPGAGVTGRRSHLTWVLRTGLWPSVKANSALIIEPSLQPLKINC